jgi:hypothetical protein
MLPDEIYRLHYLVRRHQLCSLVDILGDELDVFAVYVMYGFASKTFQNGGSTFVLGASYHLKDCVVNGKVVFPTTSSVRNTKYFEKVLQYILARRPDSYFDLAFSVLDISPDDQKRFEAAMKELRGRAKYNVTGIDVCSLAVKQGPISLVVCGAVYGDIDRETRKNTLFHALIENIELHAVKAGLLIARDIEFGEAPYSLAMFLPATALDDG